MTLKLSDKLGGAGTGVGAPAAAVVVTGRTLSANATLVIGDKDKVALLDSSGGAFTLTLPASPSVDDTYYLLDAKGTFDTQNVTLASANYFGLVQTVTLDVPGTTLRVTYRGATVGWTVTPNDPIVQSSLLDTVIAAHVGGANPHPQYKRFTQSTVAPVLPAFGDEWLNETSGVLFTFVNDGLTGQWIELGPQQPVSAGGKAFTQGVTAPVNPNIGDDWLDETSNTLFTFVMGLNATGQWVELGPKLPLNLEVGKKFTQGTVQPVSPSVGDDWLDENSSTLYTYVLGIGGVGAWVELGPALTPGKRFIQSVTQPPNPNIGDDWLDETTGVLLTYVMGANDVGTWVELGPIIAPGKRFTQSVTAPSAPNLGDDWLDDTTGTLLTFVAGVGGVGQWVELGPTPVAIEPGKKFTQSATQPTNPSIGDDWLDETTGTLFTFVADSGAGQWVELGSQQALSANAVVLDSGTNKLMSGTTPLALTEVTAYVNLTASGIAATGACELAGYDCTTAAGNITIYDNTSATGVVIVPTTALVVGRVEFNWKRALNTGCYVVLSGAATVNVLVG